MKKEGKRKQVITGWSIPLKYYNNKRLIYKTKKELDAWIDICIRKKPQDLIPIKVKITIEEP